MNVPRHRVDPEGRRLPIKLDTTSNGEFVPVPLSRANRVSVDPALAAFARALSSPVSPRAISQGGLPITASKPAASRSRGWKTSGNSSSQ